MNLLNKLQALRNASTEEGFTLLELIVVVVIIGILAAIAIPVFSGQIKAATFATVKSDVRNLVPVVLELEGTGYRPDSGTCHGFGDHGICDIQVESGTYGNPVRETKTVDSAITGENMISIHRVSNASAGTSIWWACGFTPSKASMTKTQAYGYNSVTGKFKVFENATECFSGTHFTD